MAKTVRRIEAKSAVDTARKRVAAYAPGFDGNRSAGTLAFETDQLL